MESDPQWLNNRVIMLWLAVFVLLVAVVSLVTARALGGRLETSIAAGYTQLEGIGDRYTEKISEIAPGTDTLKQSLREIITRYFNAKIGSAHDWEIFQWLEQQGVPVSDFRHDKIMGLIHQGRKEYRNTVVTIRRERDLYRDALDSLYSGFWLHMSGFPTIDVTADPIQEGSG